MYKHKLDRPFTCGVDIATEENGWKWKACHIYNIKQGLRRPSQLHRQNPNAPLRVINQQLRELELHGVVRKIIYPVLPPKAEYFLTPLGESLLPIIKVLEAWGDAHGDALKDRMRNGVESEAFTTA